MFEIFTLILFGWLFIQSLRLTCRITWGAVKIISVILFTVALPVLIGCLLLAGGILLLLPVALVAIAFCILKACT